MRRIVLAFVRSVGRSVSCWKLCHSEHVLGAKTDAANSPRVSLALFLSPSLPSSRSSVPFLPYGGPSRSFPLALITLPSYNAPLCSATVEPCIFLDAMDFPKAFRCSAPSLAPFPACLCQTFRDKPKSELSLPPFHHFVPQPPPSRSK